MSNNTEISCTCGQTRLKLQGEPILVTECLCDSCRAAAIRLKTLTGGKTTLTPYGATPCAEYRKDRVQILSGNEHLREFRLSDDAGSRRVIAACCNTPLFLEMKGAHWLSVYLNLWPDDARPEAEVRTMTGDLSDPSSLPNDIPNLKSHSMSFYAKLLWAWIKMGFRNSKIQVTGKINA